MSNAAKPGTDPLSPRANEVKIRATAVYTNTPIMTTLSRAKAAVPGIAASEKSGHAVKTIQDTIEDLRFTSWRYMTISLTDPFPN
jgi:hypothetical protein